MRGRKVTKNAVFSLLTEVVAVICGFILPRFILVYFGSVYNGLTASITQFLSCAVLLRAGIGGATRAALYRPLVDRDQSEINAIVKATDLFMKKIGLILAGMIVVFASVYPVFVKNDFGWFFTFSLFLIIGASTFAESFFGTTYLIVLQADQQLWVASLLRIFCYIANTIIGVVLMINGFGIHMVKAGSALVYVLYPIVQGIYVRKRYRIDLNCEPNNSAIAQRWDAFWHQVAVFVMNNTGVIVLTVFANLLEVSVYSMYNMVVNALRTLFTSFFTALEASFGNMIAKREENALRENVAVVELLIFGLATAIYTSAAALIVDFVCIYTKNVTDVNYSRPLFAYLIMFAGFFNAVRMPYQTVVNAAGHYKQTKIGAIIEPILNITLSVIFVFRFGLVGVAVGTLAATIFRTVQYSVYMRKNIVPRNRMITPFRIAVSFAESAVILIILHFIHFQRPTGYLSWFIQAAVTAAISFAIVTAGSFAFFKTDAHKAVKKIRFAVFKK